MPVSFFINMNHYFLDAPMDGSRTGNLGKLVSGEIFASPTFSAGIEGLPSEM